MDKINHRYFIHFSGIKMEWFEDVSLGKARQIKTEFKSDGIYEMDKELKTLEAFAEIKKHLMKKHRIENCVITFYKKLN